MIVQQFLRFAFMGVFATAAHYAVMIGLAELFHVEPLIAVVCGFTVGAITSYLLNWRFTFTERPDFKRGLVKFLIIMGIGGVLNTSIVAFLMQQGMHYIPSQVVGTCVVLIWNFGSARLVVFRAPRAE